MPTPDGNGASGPDDDRSEVPDVFVEALLRNPHRQRIVELLTQAPGMNKNQLAEALGIYANALDFHLERMEEMGLVHLRESPRGREIVCFTADNVDLWEDERTRVLFGRSPVQRVAIYLAENPGASTADIASALDVSPVTVRHHLRTLEESELVQRLRIGRDVIYSAVPEVARLIDEASLVWDRDFEALGPS